jgi:hypothetical protein
MPSVPQKSSKKPQNPEQSFLPNLKGNPDDDITIGDITQNLLSFLIQKDVRVGGVAQW